MGLAAACAGWTLDLEVLTPFAALIQREGGAEVSVIVGSSKCAPPIDAYAGQIRD